MNTAEGLVLATADTVKQNLNLANAESVLVKIPKQEIMLKVDDTVSKLMAIGERDLTEQRNMAKAVTSLGEQSCRELTQRSQMLKTPLHTLVNDASNGGGAAASLIALQDQVNAVNPNRVDFSM